MGQCVKPIGRFAFFECESLTSVVIPDSVSSIGDQAFYYCSSLTFIDLPKSVTSVGRNTFSGCSKLVDVYHEGSKDEWSQLSIGAGNGYLTSAKLHSLHIRDYSLFDPVTVAAPFAI